MWQVTRAQWPLEFKLQMAMSQTLNDMMPLVLLPEKVITQEETQRMPLRKMRRKTMLVLALERRLSRKMLPSAVR